MKKVLAVLTIIAFAALGAPAFAASENVTIYGRAGLSVDVINTGTGGHDETLTKVSSNSSRIGFKGSEDLGDGLKAVYQVEIGVAMDGKDDKDATKDTFSLRNTYAGLSGGFGTVILGKHDTPYKSATGKYDVFSETMGDYNAIIGNINGTTDFDLRPGDVIAYVSPSLGGVQVTLASVQTYTETPNNANASAYSASAVYGDGPLSAALAYEVHTNGAATWDVAGKSVTGTKLGLGYTLEDLKLGLVYEKLDGDDQKYSRDAYYLSAEQKLGKEKIKLAIGMAGDTDAASNTGATFGAIGIEHGFSKRTAIYALYAMTKNDTGAKYGLGQSGAGGKYHPDPDKGIGNSGEDPSCISIGVRHNF